MRAQHTAPAPEASADLFRPQKPPTLPLPGEEGTAAPATGSPKSPAEPAPSTASRLLEAKRRAHKRQG